MDNLDSAQGTCLAHFLRDLRGRKLREFMLATAYIELGAVGLLQQFIAAMSAPGRRILLVLGANDGKLTPAVVRALWTALQAAAARGARVQLVVVCMRERFHVKVLYGKRTDGTEFASDGSPNFTFSALTGKSIESGTVLDARRNAAFGPLVRKKRRSLVGWAKLPGATVIDSDAAIDVLEQRGALIAREGSTESATGSSSVPAHTQVTGLPPARKALASLPKATTGDKKQKSTQKTAATTHGKVAAPPNRNARRQRLPQELLPAEEAPSWQAEFLAAAREKSGLTYRALAEEATEERRRIHRHEQARQRQLLAADKAAVKAASGDERKELQKLLIKRRKIVSRLAASVRKGPGSAVSTDTLHTMHNGPGADSERTTLKSVLNVYGRRLPAIHRDYARLVARAIKRDYGPAPR